MHCKHDCAWVSIRNYLFKWIFAITLSRYIEVNRHGAIRYFEQPIFDIKNSKIILLTTATPLTCIGTGVMLWDCTHQIHAVLTSIPVCVIQWLITWFLYIWSMLCLYLELFTIEFKRSKNLTVKRIVNKTIKLGFSQWW